MQSEYEQFQLIASNLLAVLLIGIFLFGVGIFQLFWGYRFYRPVIAVQGFVGGALLGGLLALNRGAEPGMAAMSALGGGLILALLSIPLYHVFLFIGCVLCGFTTGLMIGEYVEQGAAYAGMPGSGAEEIGGMIGWPLAIILAIAGGIVVFLWRKHVIIYLTAWAGAASVAAALVHVAQAFAPEFLIRLNIDSPTDYRVALVSMAIFAAGALVQFRYTAERRPKWVEADPDDEIPQIHPDAAAAMEAEEP